MRSSRHHDLLLRFYRTAVGHPGTPGRQRALAKPSPARALSCGTARGVIRIPDDHHRFAARNPHPNPSPIGDGRGARGVGKGFHRDTRSRLTSDERCMSPRHGHTPATGEGAGWAGAWRDRRGSPPPNALGGSLGVRKGSGAASGEETATAGRGTGCGGLPGGGSSGWCRLKRTKRSAGRCGVVADHVCILCARRHRPGASGRGAGWPRGRRWPRRTKSPLPIKTL